MKRLIGFCLICCLLAFSLTALAQNAAPAPLTREETISIEGMDEAITTTYFESPRGYAFWIDPNHLTLVPEDEGNDIDEFVPPGAAPNSGYSLAINYSSALDYTFDLAAEDTEQMLIENYGSVQPLELSSDLFSGLPAKGWFTMDTVETENDTIICEYIVQAGEGVFYVSLTYPQVATEGFGSRVEKMLKSFEVTLP